MQGFWNVVWNYKWLILAAVAAVIFFVVYMVKKFKPLMDVAKEHRQMEEQYKELSIQKLEGLDDQTTVKAVMYNVWAQMADDMSDEFDVVDRQNDYKKNAYIVNRLTTDYEMGGFEQIYLTMSRKFGRLSPMAFEQIGAKLHADIMEKAYQVYFDNRAVFDKGEPLGEDHAYLFDELEQQMIVAAESEKIERLNAGYIRKNAERICE